MALDQLTEALKDPLAPIKEFLKLESAGGLVLMGAAVLALLISNSALGPYYDGLFALPLTISLGDFGISKALLLWVNDGLMAIFFLLVGLEIKREILEGELSSLDRAALPAVAAAGGMIVPALIYIAITNGDPVALNGWAIPAATDIAFALGILSLLGKRVPISLKIFLTALAILDDLGAIIIIALFYTHQLSPLSLGMAAIALTGLFFMNRIGVTRTAAYVLVGIFLWVCVLKSGVHATLAGVALALAIPLRATNEHGESPLKTFEHALLPWVAFGIMPLFAFANAGVSLSGLSLDSILAPVPLGIALGLFLGKQVGIAGFSWLAIRGGLCRLPDEVTWLQLYGASILAGIGFTMSLFIGTLAFSDPAYAVDVRIGVLGGSLISALTGYLLLRFATKSKAVGAGGKPETSSRKT
ncbi:MAG: Na+/H+ antiporter NhaA [Alphaproteobacteria bacterium]